ncbi:CDF family Co(II)/Ni(II) efflux transporter DmeF [Desulfosarcina sp.]|uniref:CDF family Co(II)/Ni(II) efflux transporter DmeF n=1 Tax=Desulfosarcina sp. TaxID=2027861 RepID=UPI0029A1A38C|nr:CDF family Co(II)/Ni(II) efflux transporter DmeF [Desulfosarcina sp.]MDX2454052.1 CDF family Co(II)/Ni(II) efflux transporter DmeF [Desulfosarcina sp.]MDX2491739.1 CDF family Co(II)/Ni(II) efflux transporter DmeF [Desulfosarcina sp.]
MILKDETDLNHSHSFGQDHKRPGESRTLIVIVVTAVMMVVEITTGMLFGSMALLADGLHMASHAAALSINAFAYIYARRHAHDKRFSFGTGKVNALGGFSGAVLLAVFAVMMAVESVVRLVNPVAIAFNQAIFVAIIGLVVNGLSMLILGHKDGSHHGNDHGHDHDHHHHDHNLRSAYLHVLADALTSFLAIFALLTAKYVGLIWMDPLMGIVGAIMVSRWSIGLLISTSHVLLDRQASVDIQQKVVDGIQKNGDNRVADLHLWTVGPDIYAAIVSVVTEIPKPPEYYKQLIPSDLKFVHVTVEVNRT